MELLNLKKITVQRAFNLFTQYLNTKSNFKGKKDMQYTSKSRDISIFIVGCERSGTTLMEKILDEHSQIAICPETHFWMDSIDKKINKILSQRKSNKIIISEIKTFVNEFKEFSDHWEEYNLKPSVFLDSNKIDRARSESIYKMIIEGQARKRGKPIFGEKTPGHVFSVDKIIEIYPNARIIQMIRNPRDTTISRLNKKNEKSKSIFDKLLNALFVNIEWNLSTKLARRYQKLLEEKYLVISFEELLQNPREKIERICNFLDINFEESMLNVSTINSSFSNESNGFDRSTINRWRKNMPLWLEIIINFVNGREMKIMEY